MKDKEEIDRIYFQIKNYKSSSDQIITIFNNEKIDSNWIEDEFYAISSEYINKWKSLIHYNEIIDELNKRNRRDNIDDIIDKKIIIKKIENLNINLNDINNLSFIELNSSISEDNIDTQKSINPYMDFELISKKAYESFIEDENNRNLGKISIKKGIKRILIKIPERFYIIFYMDNKNGYNINQKNIIKLVIEIINEGNIDSLNEFINTIIKINISDFFSQIKYDLLERKKQYIYKKVKFFLYQKREAIFSVNQSSINKIESQINKSSTISLIRDIDYINTLIITKIKNSSYIIASMYSLSQITEFAQYFYADNINFSKCSNLIIFFKKYMNELLKKNDNNNDHYEPKDFMKILRSKDNKIFDFLKEKEPIDFIKKIFEYINYELNNKDKDIENELNNFTNSFNEEDKFMQFYNRDFMKNCNSIVSKVFYGIFQEKCESCGEKFRSFKYIDLNITEYSNYQSKLDNSLTFYYLDDLIEFYFSPDNESNNCKFCKIKKINKTIDKKIIKFPETIIINIRWGEFSKDNGFNYVDNLKEKGLLLEQNKFIIDEIIDLTNFNVNKNEKIKYKIRSIINYPIINDTNKDIKYWKKYITFSRHFVNDKYYSYQPSGTVDEIHNFNRKKFVPCVLFYEKI